MTPARALAFVRRHGVVLESGHGAVPSVAETIAGERIRGSWWSHPLSQVIFRVTRALRDSPEVLVCRLVAGKVTFVHADRWPALVRVAERFPRAHLARLHEEHTATGQHALRSEPFPDWVPGSVQRQARTLTCEAALARLPPLPPARPRVRA